MKKRLKVVKKIKREKTVFPRKASRFEQCIFDNRTIRMVQYCTKYGVDHTDQ